MSGWEPFDWRHPTQDDLGMLNVVRLAQPISVSEVMAGAQASPPLDFRRFIAAGCLDSSPQGLVLSERGKKILADAGWQSEPP